MKHVVFIASLLACGFALAETPAFSSAQPVWLAGRETEMNVFAGFRAVFDKPGQGSALLRVTASTLYRCYVNGEFAGHGPARGPHGHFRVDERDITPWLKPGKNIVAIEVAGYNANAYYVLDQPSFVQAEVRAGGAVIAATGDAQHPMEAFALSERVQKVQRYSFQRPFIEYYRLSPQTALWRGAPEAGRTAAQAAVQPVVSLLPRRVPFPSLDIRPVNRHLASGALETMPPPKHAWRDRSLTEISPKLKGYPREELETVVSDTLQQTATVSRTEVNAAVAPDASFALSANTFQLLDLGQNLSGFITLNVQCASKTRLYVLFDEMLTENDVNFLRLGCVSALSFELEPGEYRLEGFEPNTMRYLKLVCLGGECTVSHVGLRLYENPDTLRATFDCADDRIDRLFEAGRSTFAQNAVDIFMDCPHRERAGWLCDSFFTARSAFSLSGNAHVEQNFLENFLLPAQFAHLPKGMLPMCYPSDHNDGVFIPNWSMWFVLELDEYAARTGDTALVEALRPKVLDLLAYFKGFENSDGLLEKLESWVFVEWSKANEFVQDVNYPSNMLYAGMLSAAARLYSLPELEAKVEALRATIRKQAGAGAFFVDNALRKNGQLEVTKNHSEVCQYFAFYFGLATPETHPELWRRLQQEFGPQRKETKAWHEVHPANSFIGNMLRMELLSRDGRSQQILDESIGYLEYMAERTGTLWENISDNASLNHGFASHIVHTLQRDIAGLYRIDPLRKEIHLRFTALNLPACRATVPVGDAEIRMEWRVNGDRLEYRLDAPTGYTVRIDNRSGKQLAELPKP